VRYERISVEPFREPPGSEASAKGLPRRPQSTWRRLARQHMKIPRPSKVELRADPGLFVRI